MAGAAQTIGWILTIDDTDLTNKLGSIKTNVSGIQDSLTSSMMDALKPAIKILEDIKKVGEEIKIGVESLLDPDNWKSIGKVMKDMMPTVESVQEVLDKATVIGITKKSWWDRVEQFTNDFVNAVVDVFKIGKFILGAVKDISVLTAAIVLSVKAIAGPILSGILGAVKKLIGFTLSTAMSAIKTVGGSTLKSGINVVRALTVAFKTLGKFAAATMGAALGPIYTVMKFLSVGLSKALGPVFSIVNDFVGALMFAFEPFFMAFRMLLIPFVYRLLPIIVQAVAIIAIQIADLLVLAAKWWAKWADEGWGVFWEDLQYLAGDLWKDLKVVAAEFWGWLSTTGWKNFKESAEVAWKAMKKAVIGFGDWFTTTAWPVIVEGLESLTVWLVDVLPKAWESWQTWVNKSMVPWVLGLRERAIEGLSKALLTAWKFWKDKLSAAWDLIKYAFGGIGDLLMVPINWIRSVMGGIIADIGWLLVAAGNKAIDSRIKGISGMGVGIESIGRSILYAGEALRIPVKKLQEGGLVTKPTLALVGERGPEIVIPLTTGEVALSAGADAAVTPIDDPLRWFKDALGKMLMALEKIDQNTTDSGWVNDSDFSGQSTRGNWEK